MSLLRIALAILICAFGYQVSLASELTERDQIAAECINHLASARFDELEMLVEQYTVSQERTPSGAWKLAVCYLGIQNHYTNPAEKHNADRWDKRHAILKKWREQVPESAAARLVEAMVMIEESIQIRGSKLDSKDPIAMVRIAAKRMKQARHHLLESKKIASHDPHWYVLMGQTGLYTGQARNEFFLVMEEGYDRHPKYLELYNITIRFLDANWPGDHRLYEALANSAVARTEVSEGLALYARIYRRAYSNPVIMSLITEPAMHWNKMKEAMDDVLKKYPDQWNIQSFTFYACLARDKKKATELFAQITGTPIDEAWQHPNHYKRCRTLVNEPA